MTTCEESYEMTKRQLDDIQWQASFLKHETPSTKMAAERADLSCTCGLIFCVFMHLAQIYIQTFEKNAKISCNWAVTGDFF